MPTSKTLQQWQHLLELSGHAKLIRGNLAELVHDCEQGLVTKISPAGCWHEDAQWKLVRVVNDHDFAADRGHEGVVNRL